jgi:hypothetical protein
VTADDDDTGAPRHLATAPHDFLEQPFIQQLAREPDQIERKQRPRAHRVNVR